MKAPSPPRCLLLESADLIAVAGGASLEALSDLAEALVGSDPWRGFAGNAAVALAADPPRLALMGYFDSADEARVNALSTELNIARHGLLFVDYADAQHLTTSLAERLREGLSDSEINAARLMAVPRGGHVVLGMLVYALPAGSDQLEPGPADLWIVVDDCSLSGARFLQWLADHPGPDVVFAHLYSHPDLRSVLEEHPRVRSCVAGADLADHAPTRLGDGYGAWRAAWKDRDSGVWAGQTDRIAFAWNEPDTAIWNPATGQVEKGWHLIGPRRCLKNRQRIPQGAIQVLRGNDGEMQPGPDALWVDLRDEILLANAATEAVVRLTGVGAEMWRTATTAPTEAEARDRLGEQFEVEPDRLQSDWDQFVSQLVAQGFLIRS